MSTVSCERVQTARLLCERLRLEHASEVSTLLRDPRVAKTLTPDGLPLSERDVRDGLRAKISHWERYGFGLWMVRDRASGEMVGRGGLQHTFVGGSSEIEVGWAIVPGRWGQGLATELALASVNTATEMLHLPEIVAFRLLQGFFGAALVPIAQSILLDIYTPEERGSAMALFGVSVMVGPVLGPVIGGA